jgi:AbrB family looped-hinge helix DNA binding protein
MTTRNITITSKNQITIPADIVRDMRLGTHRRLSLRKRDGELILKPEPELKDQLQKIWSQLPTFQGTTNDKELKRTTKETWVNKTP